MGTSVEDFEQIDKSFKPLYRDEGNRSRIRTIEEHLGFSITPPSGLRTKEFCLIGEGNLKKICRKVPKERYFVLFSHQLIYCNFPPQDRNMRRPLLKTKVMNTCGMDVEECSNFQVGDMSYEHCLKIQTAEKSFIVVMESPDEQMAWLDYIRSAIQHSNMNYMVKPKKMTSSAPVWTPDQNCSVCPVCNKTKFTAINRRHHCRKCGTLMCGDCQRYQEDKAKKKKEKVCFMCLDIAKGKSSFQSPSQMVPLPKTVSDEERAQLAAQQKDPHL
ncbi:pleckstrin homology domain-containing family F member 2-like isoform X2 [Symsagittifera roscoffensis]|uniref:pleckstrin homology domain-containing family F member 2-like isoform X2 n=1 Tax=Symsagittifera roscoffensis TaxID=84072 RepID=UPI00307BC11D